MDNEQKITNDIKVPNKDLEVLKKHFSHCFDKNGNFDIEKFKQELSENEIDFYKESYSMDWLGKSYARLLASDSATTLLKENEEFNSKEENKNSENLLIKGDNLEVLKHLSNAYYEKIKMIYIDPPYNTGSDGFVYQDDRKFTVSEFRRLAGVDEEKAKRILSFVDSKSNSHSAWLTFMYPRLYIAKQLLKDDGVIFISIDDNEVAQLRLLMDEIFGEENFEANIIPIVNPGGRDYKQIAITNEYLLVYSKTDATELNELPQKTKFKFEDNNGGYNLRELRNRNPKFHSGNRPNLFYPFYVNPTNCDNNYCSVSLKKDKEHNIEVKPYNSEGKESVWRWGKDKANSNIVLNNLDLSQIVAKQKSDGNWNIYEKNRRITTKSKSVWNETEMRTENGTRHLRDLFSANYFDHPKPIGLVKRCVQIGVNKNDLILDFFAGSGTTGDAVMQLNAEDGGNRKYILVQLPEPIDPKKNKTTYEFVNQPPTTNHSSPTTNHSSPTTNHSSPTTNHSSPTTTKPTIFEITKERLIRAGKKIENETIKTKIAEKENKIKDLETQLDIDGKDEKIKQLKAEIKVLKNQDLGFKIFETMPIWEDYNFEVDELNEQTTLFDESRLTKDDLKALLVTWKTYDGISLTESLQEINLVSNSTNHLSLTTNHYIAYYTNDKLYLINKGFKTENLKALLEKIDSDKKFNPTSIIAFGYHFESKNLREIAENIKSYANKKSIDIDFVIRY